LARIEGSSSIVELRSFDRTLLDYFLCESGCGARARVPRTNERPPQKNEKFDRGVPSMEFWVWDYLRSSCVVFGFLRAGTGDFFALSRWQLSRLPPLGEIVVLGKTAYDSTHSSVRFVVGHWSLSQALPASRSQEASVHSCRKSSQKTCNIEHRKKSIKGHRA